MTAQSIVDGAMPMKSSENFIQLRKQSSFELASATITDQIISNT